MGSDSGLDYLAGVRCIGRWRRSLLGVEAYPVSVETYWLVIAPAMLLGLSAVVWLWLWITRPGWK